MYTSKEIHIYKHMCQKTKQNKKWISVQNCVLTMNCDRVCLAHKYTKNISHRTRWWWHILSSSYTLVSSTLWCYVCVVSMRCDSALVSVYQPTLHAVEPYVSVDRSKWSRRYFNKSPSNITQPGRVLSIYFVYVDRQFSSAPHRSYGIHLPHNKFRRTCKNTRRWFQEGGLHTHTHPYNSK